MGSLIRYGTVYRPGRAASDSFSLSTSTDTRGPPYEHVSWMQAHATAAAGQWLDSGFEGQDTACGAPYSR